MTAARSPAPGETRPCPHCAAQILTSAPACPACHRHLDFDAVRSDRPITPTFCPLHVEGTIHHPGSGEPWEYAVVVQVHDAGGEIVSRHVMGAGALRPTEGRTFIVRVEVFTPQKSSC